MNKKITVIVIFLFFTIILTNTVFSNTIPTFEIIRMTSGNGTVNEITNYGWTETPWLYLKLPDNGLNIVGAVWSGPQADDHIIDSSGYSSEIWLAFDNWSNIRKKGQWEITAHFILPLSNVGYYPPAGIGTAGFTVNAPVAPEPVSSVLFITGSAVFAVRRYRQKKKCI